MKEKIPLSILADSSFILTMLRGRQDFEGELQRLLKRKFQVIIPSRVMFELERLGRKKSSTTSGLARVAVELIEKRKYHVLEISDGPSDVDSSLITTALSQKGPIAVATVDVELKKALGLQDIPTISPRGRAGLILSSALPSSP